jgi:hypothetical protein
VTDEPDKKSHKSLSATERSMLAPVRERFAEATKTVACGPFVALVRFALTPADSDYPIVDTEMSKQASLCVWPNVWIASLHTDEGLYRWSVPGEKNSLFFVDDRAGRQNDYLALAQFAVGRLSTEKLGWFAGQFWPDSVWTGFVFRTLGQCNLLAKRQILDGRARALWYAGSIFHASLAALDALLGADADWAGKKGPSEEQTELTAVERAMMLYTRDSNRSIASRAREAGCDRSLLYKDERFKRLRQANQGRLPKGSKSKEGDIESEWDDER